MQPDEGPSLLERLPDQVRVEVLAAARPLEVAAGAWLFRQGEPGDSLYVVESGRLELIVESPQPEMVVGTLGPGDVVGELAVVTGATRAASARARRTTHLLRLDRGAFETLLRDNAAFSASLLHSLADKLRHTETLRAAPRTAVRVLCVASLAPDVTSVDIARSLTVALGGTVSTRVLDPDLPDRWRQIDQLERDVELVVVPTTEDPADIAECVRYSDRAVAFARRRDTPVAGEIARALRGCDVILVGRHGPVAPWLDALECRAHHLVLANDDAVGLGRAARRITGRATGTVLSGGGARGFAHIGVVSELLSAGISLDRVGGCSMGALIGALVASGRSLEDIERLCRLELVDRHPFRDYTVPRSSLIRGRSATAMLHRLFGDSRIEELPLDYFAVSADLTTAALVVHRRGFVATAVAASMAVPGLVPPVIHGQQLLVDGGVIDNLPVDVMDDAGEGPVIGVDVMGRRLTTRRRPTIVDVLARATVLGSWRWVAANEARAAAIIRPDLHDVGLLDFDRIDTAIASGRVAARAAVRSGQI